MATDTTQWLRECQDSVDYVTLDELSDLKASELVLLEMPQPWRNGVRYRCLARESLVDYANTSVQRVGVSDGPDRATGRVLMPTYLPGVDLDLRDLDFLVRLLQTPSSSSSPTILHVSRIKDSPVEQVWGYRETAVHIYEIAEAQWERDLWQIFDRVVTPSNGTCPLGHALRKQPVVRDNGRPGWVICDLCEQTLLQRDRHRCEQGCDYDLCEECFGGGLPKEAEADRPCWLKRELARFFSQHPGFCLPQEIPQQSLVVDVYGQPVSEPSTAITKWNSFTLPEEDILQLRRIFLRALHGCGVNLDALQPIFWPGCAEQRQVVADYLQEALQGQPVAAWRQNAAACRGALVCVGASGFEALESDPEEGSEVRLASGREVLAWHARRLESRLGAAWRQEDREELLDSMAAAQAGGPLLQESLRAAVPELAPPPTLFSLAAYFVHVVVHVLGTALRKLFRRWWR